MIGDGKGRTLISKSFNTLENATQKNINSYINIKAAQSEEKGALDSDCQRGGRQEPVKESLQSETLVGA